ncbi:MAG: leucyl aminopeptidase [Chlamydiia bacterium]|nr:leucyl aminopeptidase [Chlamydiia bacterium]
MQFSIITELKNRKASDVIVFPFWEGAKRAKAAASLGSFDAEVKLPIETGDFTGGEGEILLIYTKGNKEQRCLLLGLGKEGEIAHDGLRLCFAKLAKFLIKHEFLTVNLVFPHVAEFRGMTVEEGLGHIVTGLLLSNYQFGYHVNEKIKKLLEHVTLIGVLPEMLTIIKKCQQISEGVYLARDLINGNAHEVTPTCLANLSKKIAANHQAVSLTLFDKSRILKEKMGLLAAVARGSAEDPVLIILSYKGAPRVKDHTVIVGKGITFDTGGLNLKPTGSIESMRDDMSGAATALATLATVAELGLKKNITAVVPSTENAIGSTSFKPGDVFYGYNGKTVEIGNTDAEGRLILADALAYTVKNLKPSRIIDLATLTGSMVIALGDGIAGMMSNDDKLSRDLITAGENTAEPLWRLPLFSPYKEQLSSDIADLKNVGGRPGGAITAALFLQEFVDHVPWAHIDIAGTAFLNKEKGYWPKNGVGFGVRLLINFLERL